MPPSPLLWINAGEVSGDMHGAGLVRAFRLAGVPARFVGMGGEELAREGMETLLRSEDLSLVGLTEVVGHLPRILRLLARTRRLLAQHRPAAVILIDAPEYNFRVAKMAHQLGIPVYFYISPQVWAWRTGRVRFLARYARKILCILPFEQAFYARHGVAAEYVGSPLLDHLPLPELLALDPDPELVGILPGSRRREVTSLLPRFAAAARILRQQRPGLRFQLLRAPTIAPEMLRSLWDPDLPAALVEPQDRYPAMRRSGLLLAASGTVTLEAALLGTPTLVAYRVAPLTHLAGVLLIHAEYMSLPNLVLGKRVFPELVQGQTAPETMARVADKLLDPALNAAVRAELDELRRLMGAPGAAQRAAAIIAKDLGLTPANG